MNNMNNKKSRVIKHLETFIVILIAGCMIFLINFTNTKLEQFTALEEEVILINHNPADPIHNQLAQEIVAYRPDTYKMIEIYTEEFNILMSLQFMETEVPDRCIENYPELVELFSLNNEGHTDFMYTDREGNEIKQDIYFKWVTASDNERYLIITYSMYHPVDNLWVFNFIAYTVIILVFLLLISIKVVSYNEKIKQYESVSKSVRSRIIEKE